jgi:hypothetical protein
MTPVFHLSRFWQMWQTKTNDPMNCHANESWTVLAFSAP